MEKKQHDARKFIVKMVEMLRSGREEEKGQLTADQFINILGNKGGVKGEDLDKAIDFLKNINRKELGQVLAGLYMKEKKRGRDLISPPLNDLADFYREKIMSDFVFRLDWYYLETLREANRKILENTKDKEILGTLTNVFDDILSDLCQEAREKTLMAYREIGKKAA